MMFTIAFISESDSTFARAVVTLLCFALLLWVLLNFPLYRVYGGVWWWISISTNEQFGDFQWNWMGTETTAECQDSSCYGYAAVYLI
jgi:hypothetical protein